MRKQIIISSIAGAAAGMAGGLLLAPQSGRSLRQRIAGGAGNIVTRIRNLFTGNVEEEEALQEEQSERKRFPGEVDQPNPRTINPTHLNQNPVNQMVHKNKSNLSGRH